MIKLSELQDLLADYAEDGEDPEFEIYDRRGDAIECVGLGTLIGIKGRQEFEKVIFYDQNANHD